MCSENGIVLAFNWQPLQAKCFAASPMSHTQHNALLHASWCNRPTSCSTKYKGNLLIELLNHYVNIVMLCTCNERQLWQAPLAPPYMAISRQIWLCFWGDYSCDKIVTYSHIAWIIEIVHYYTVILGTTTSSTEIIYNSCIQIYVWVSLVTLLTALWLLNLYGLEHCLNLVYICTHIDRVDCIQMIST